MKGKKVSRARRNRAQAAALPGRPFPEHVLQHLVVGAIEAGANVLARAGWCAPFGVSLSFEGRLELHAPDPVGLLHLDGSRNTRHDLESIRARLAAASAGYHGYVVCFEGALSGGDPPADRRAMLMEVHVADGVLGLAVPHDGQRLDVDALTDCQLEGVTPLAPGLAGEDTRPDQD